MNTLIEVVKKHLPFVTVQRKGTSKVRLGNRIAVAFYHTKLKAIFLSKSTNVYITDVFVFVHEVGHAIFDTWRMSEDEMVEELIVRRFVSLVFSLDADTANDYLVEYWQNWKKQYPRAEDPDFQRIIDGSDALWRTDLAQKLTKLVKSRTDIGI